MNLASSSVRSFTLLDAKNTLIFSTIALSNELQSQLSAVPCTVASLGASFALDIEHWRTDERTCALLRFPLVAEQPGEGFQTFPVFAFATAEAAMPFAELRQRCVLYFRVCQALLQPAEFRPPWTFHVQTLSVQPTSLMSLLCSAERLVDRNPAALHLCMLQYPPVAVKQLETGPASPSRLIRRCVQAMRPDDNDDVPTTQIKEILEDVRAAVFIDDQLFGTFSCNTNDGDSCKMDALDGLVLTVLQSDDRFMTGCDFQYQINTQEESEALLAKTKRVISNETTEDCAVETRPAEELDGQRVLQLRINQKLTSAVCIFRQVELLVELPAGYPRPRCRICYVFLLTNTLHQVLKTQCDNNLTQLIQTCRGYVCRFLPDFERYISEETYLHVLNAHNPERGFSLRYQISSFPGLLYCSVKNVTRGTVLAPNLEIDHDLAAIVGSDVLKDISMENDQTSEKQQRESPLIMAKQPPNRPFTEPQGFVKQVIPAPSPVLDISNNTSDKQLIKLIRKQVQIARLQVRKLLEMEHLALSSGITYAVERDEQYCRVLWLFYSDVTPRTTDSTKVVMKNDVTSIQGLWPQDASTFTLPLARQQLVQLNQTEEVVPKRRTEYAEQGGYVCTPQYWTSVERLARESKTFIKQTQLNPTATFELFEIQAVFLNLVSLDDIREMTHQLFLKFANLVWGDTSK